MKAILHVLSLGSVDSYDTVREALLQQHCLLSVVTSLWDMYTIAQQNSFDVVILQHTLARLEVRNASEYIRKRWPRAKILVIRADTEVLNDPLYDKWAPPGLPTEVLLTIIEQLTGSG